MNNAKTRYEASISKQWKYFKGKRTYVDFNPNFLNICFYICCLLTNKLFSYPSIIFQNAK